MSALTAYPFDYRPMLPWLLLPPLGSICADKDPRCSVPGAVVVNRGFAFIVTHRDVPDGGYVGGECRPLMPPGCSMPQIDYATAATDRFLRWATQEDRARYGIGDLGTAMLEAELLLARMYDVWRRPAKDDKRELIRAPEPYDEHFIRPCVGDVISYSKLRRVVCELGNASTPTMLYYIDASTPRRGRAASHTTYSYEHRADAEERKLAGLPPSVGLTELRELLAVHDEEEALPPPTKPEVPPTTPAPAAPAAPMAPIPECLIGSSVALAFAVADLCSGRTPAGDEDAWAKRIFRFARAFGQESRR